MADRVKIDRSIKRSPNTSFLDIDLFISSGLKSLIGDVKDGNRSDLSSTQKQTNMLNLLNKNINTEKILDLELGLGIPAPNFRLYGIDFDLSLFGNVNVGAMVSFLSGSSALNPQAEAYLKKDIKVGASIKLKAEKYFDGEVLANIYRLSRSDVSSSLDYTTLSSKGQIIETSDLNKEEISYQMDLGYLMNYQNGHVLYEIQELKLRESVSQKVPLYGNRPFYHIHGELDLNEEHTFKTFLGFHSRFNYSLFNGLYAGIKTRPIDSAPFYINGKISAQFLTLFPQFKTRYFEFNYVIKLPMENPQNDLWVSTIHAFELNFPFP